MKGSFNEKQQHSIRDKSMQIRCVLLTPQPGPETFSPICMQHAGATDVKMLQGGPGGCGWGEREGTTRRDGHAMVFAAAAHDEAEGHIRRYQIHGVLPATRSTCSDCVPCPLLGMC